MIATVGYDGFLYSIGYLAGWIVALFVVAEPMKRLGKYTFTDALDSKFNSRGIKLAAAISTLVVSVCYLIPQMVGAGVLVEPLLGLPHHWGVIMVGAIVITIVATAGMASTTYVQFLKGALLIVFSLVLVVAVCHRGFSTKPDQGGKVPFHEYKTLAGRGGRRQADAWRAPGWQVLEVQEVKAAKATFARLARSDRAKETWWLVEPQRRRRHAARRRSRVAVAKDGQKLVNGAPGLARRTRCARSGNIELLRGDSEAAGRLGLARSACWRRMSDKDTMVERWKDAKLTDKDGDEGDRLLSRPSRRATC